MSTQSPQFEALKNAAHDLAAAVAIFEQVAYEERRLGDQKAYNAARDLTGAAHYLLNLESPAAGFRVRMTADGAGALADREMDAVPRAGDVIASRDGTLRVSEVVWNFDPAIPCDIVLFMVSPGDPYSEPSSPAHSSPKASQIQGDSHRDRA